MDNTLAAVIATIVVVILAGIVMYIGSLPYEIQKEIAWGILYAMTFIILWNIVYTILRPTKDSDGGY